MAIVKPRGPGGGAMQEYVAAPAASCAVLAPSVNLIEAATIPMNGLTAKMAIEQLGLKPGSTLLVTGGAGALGGYAIQMGKYFGLTVIADGKDSDVELLRGLGADKIVPRGDAMAASVRRLYPDGVDGLIDAALLKDVAGPLVRDGGAAVAVRFTHTFTDPRLRASNVAVISQATNASAMAWLAEKLAEGVITARVAKQVPMREAAEAHRLVEAGGLRGRVVLTF
jgi:NADPH:quinone reductase-like Zn-dependent oxidoreductase